MSRRHGIASPLRHSCSTPARMPPALSWPHSSEKQLQPKLNQPWIVQDSIHSPIRWIAEPTIRTAEPRVVKDVEELRPELQVDSLRHAGVFNGGEVEIDFVVTARAGQCARR